LIQKGLRESERLGTAGLKEPSIAHGPFENLQPCAGWERAFAGKSLISSEMICFIVRD